MVIALLGQTDKRPVMYCLMKLFQKLGDCAIFTSDRHLKRLTDTGTEIGHYQNIFIAVSDASSDEIFREVGYTTADFENIIYDCTEQLPDYADMVIYVGGAGGISEDEQTLLDMQSDYKIINLGFGDKAIPYTVEMFKAVEQVEGLGHLGPINQQIAQRLATFLTLPLQMPVKNIVKVVMSK